MTRTTLALAASLVAAAAQTARAQDGSIVYKLGHDTVAIETFSRTPTRFSGQLVSRQGLLVVRTDYDITLASGKPSLVVVKRMAPDGSALPNVPTEYRFTFSHDTIERVTV